MARPNLRPRPKPSKAPFPFLALPTELRLQIYNYLISSESTSCYGPADPPADPPGPRLRQHRRRYALRCHGMLLANRQLHAEYAQAFYKRTNFIFYVDDNNGTTTPFWTLPPALLPNLRRCDLTVQVGMLALVPGFSMEALAARIEALLGCMERVRWVHLMLDLRGMAGGPMGKEWAERWEKQLWRERFVQHLKEGAEMRGTTVTINSSIQWSNESETLFKTVQVG